MPDDEKSLMQEIVAKLSYESENESYKNDKCKYWIDNINHWDEKFIDTKEFARNIKQVISRKTTNIIDKNKSIEIRKRHNITVVKKGSDISAFRGEELLERLIQIANKDELGNQIIPKLKRPGKQLIDLATFKNGYIKKIIELKILKENSNGKSSTNTPLYAIIELIKNYYLCGGDESGINELILLAPNDYYIKFNVLNNKKFKDLLANLNNIFKPEINIKIKVIRLELENNFKKWKEKTDSKIAKYINDKGCKWEDPKPNENNKRTKKYDKKTEIQLNEFTTKMGNCNFDYLKFEAWIEICN